MSKVFIGDVCAHMIAGGKARYIRVGSAFKDEKFGSIFIKLDSLPITVTEGQQWTGWLNVFNRESSEQKKTSERKSSGSYNYDDDDTPF